MAYREPPPRIDRAVLLSALTELAVELYGADRPQHWAPGTYAWNRWDVRMERLLPNARAVVVGYFGLTWADVPPAAESAEWRRMLAEFGLMVPNRWSPRAARLASLDDPTLPVLAQTRPSPGIQAIERWRELRTWCPRLHGWVPVGRIQLFELR